MHLEIKVALNFIISYLYNKLPRRRADLFGEELERLLKQKYEGHWYPEKPLKGSGYRCVHIGETVDPIVEQATRRSGLDIEDIRANVPPELSLWIDPFEVSYQIGEKGAVKVLYMDDNENSAELDKEIKSSFNPEAQVFTPITDQGNSLSNSPSPSFGNSVSPTFIPRSTQPITFTTAAFAATKFGSTKMKTGGRRMARSPTNGLMKQKGLSTSMHSLVLGNSQMPPSSLSPNAKEFVYPGSLSLYFGNENQPSSGSAPFPNAFEVAPIYNNNNLGEKAPFVEGLDFNLNTMQYPNQPFQPVVLAN
ncbi:protein Tob2-like [Scyliorhinus canicula]|uniref:protein Tob2-like n=1 Tax=Scyliorhinus canicula TaxID=7830 RepID=UPI0018F5F257|nr:protein Tob2-like [Scyliorhinus canicula]